jgi:hypothetical protein
MYAIKRISKNYDGSIGKDVETAKIVSCIKKKSDADEKMDSLNDEMKADLEYFTQLEREYIDTHNGGSSVFKEANPDGYEDFQKMRKAGIEGFVRHEIETVSKW